jgi:threonine dehydrogenase-like Zn-dependent dehydrogenase
METGDVLGHEFMGEVVEVGPGVDGSRLRVGDRVVVPFPIACGACLACRAELYSCCENTNPNADSPPCPSARPDASSVRIQASTAVPVTRSIGMAPRWGATCSRTFFR